MKNLLMQGLGAWAFCSIALAIIFLNILNRLYSYSFQTNIGDSIGQITISLKAMWQDSLCPRQKSYSGHCGYFYYPLFFPWLIYKVVGKLGISKYFTNRSEIGFLENLDQNEKNKLGISFALFKVCSLLTFPLIIQLLVFGVYIQHRNFNALALITCVVSLLFVDSVFTGTDYMISTRNVGYFIYCLFSLSLIYANNSYFSINEKLFHNYSNLLQLNNNREGIFFIFFLVSYFLCSLVLFITSQRAFQLYLALSIATISLNKHFITIYILIGLIAFFVLLNIPKINFSEYLRAHLYNRIHEQEWSYRTYGHWRYGFAKALSGNNLLKYKDDLINSSYLKCNMSGSPYYKSNLLAMFTVHRSYIYLLLISISLNDANINALSITFLLATIVPSILCIFKPFQGYGSNEVYIWGNLPFIPIMLYSSIVNSSPEATSIFIYIFLFVVLVDYLNIIRVGAYSRLSILRVFCRKNVNIFELAKKTSINKPLINNPDLLESLRNIVTIIESIALSYKSSQQLTIMCAGVHGMSLVEILAIYCNKYRRLPCSLIPAFTQIDNFGYGFYQDYDNFAVKESTIAAINPDILLLDCTREYQHNIYNKILQHDKYRILAKSNQLALVSVSGKIKIKC